MDPYGNIYRDKPEKIPAEDKARLDGYLIGKAEEGEFQRSKQEELDALRADRNEELEKVRALLENE